MLSGVRIFVETIVTSMTVPDSPPALMKSPALKGRKIRSMMPPAKFCTVPESAIPIAIPPAVSRAAKEVVSTPRVPMVARKRRTVREMLTKDEMKEASVR